MQEPMKYNISYTSESKRDLDAIWDYMVSEFQNISAAEQIVSNIMDDIDQLERFPELGPPLSSIIDIRSSHRFLVTGKYLTFYRILGTEIRIDRILYGRRDYLRDLLDDKQNT